MKRMAWGLPLLLMLLCMAGCGQAGTSTLDRASDAVGSHPPRSRVHSDSPWVSRGRAGRRRGRQPVYALSLGHPSFCGEAPMVRAFGLDRLPRVQEPPRSGYLPFGPKTVSLFGVDEDPVLRLGEGYGYRLFSEDYSGLTPLHWTLSARLLSVDRNGRPLREVDRKTIQIPTISSGETWRLYLGPLQRLGFYRYDLRIMDRRGAELAHYEKYLRAVRSFWKLRLGLNKQRLKPGQTVLTRVENLGSEEPFFGEAFKIQQRVDGHWVRPPALPPGEEWLAWGATAGPGEAGRCSAFRLPTHIPDGQYRMLKHVGSLEAKRGETLVAPFEVVGHAPVLKGTQGAALRK